MTDTKSIYIKDIVENQPIEGLFLVSETRLAETKAGKPFLTLQLMDNSGELTGRIWDNAQRFSEICKPGKVIYACGQSQLYKSALQLNISTVKPVEAGAFDLADFLPASPYSIPKMEKELLGKIDSLEDPHIKQLILAFTNDEDLWNAFKAAPAAKLMHHAYIGGLLEHTLGILRLADSIASHYPTLNRSLLFAGVFLHDFGKVKEFSFETPPFNYTDYGRLVGHMVITIELLQEKISQIKGFPEQTSMLIKHLILSHHGRYEFGSSVLPMIREAFVLHLIDDLDAKMNVLDRLSSKQESDAYQWSDYQRTLERFIYVRGHSDADNEHNAQINDAPAPNRSSSASPTVPHKTSAPAKPPVDNSKQPSLWEV